MCFGQIYVNVVSEGNPKPSRCSAQKKKKKKGQVLVVQASHWGIGRPELEVSSARLHCPAQPDLQLILNLQPVSLSALTI